MKLMSKLDLARVQKRAIAIVGVVSAVLGYILGRIGWRALVRFLSGFPLKISAW